MKLLFIIVALLMNVSASAQEKIHFSSQNYIGLLEGEQGSKFQLQTINGVVYKTWFVGLGTGIDWYYQRSIPAFASLSKHFFNKASRSFYASLDGGINYPWKEDEYYNAWGYGNTELEPGGYWSAGLGYKIGIGKKNEGILMHLGYSYKHLTEKITTVSPCLIGPCPENTEKFNYSLRRLSLKVGWNF
jgi:hypothetical protein